MEKRGLSRRHMRRLSPVLERNPPFFFGENA